MNKKKNTEINEINIMTITSRELKGKLRKLSVITTSETKSSQVIEGVYGDARFELTKEESSHCILCVLRVFGPSKDNRLSIISQFKILLDIKPVEFPAKTLPCDSLFWRAEEINKQQ